MLDKSEDYFKDEEFVGYFVGGSYGCADRKRCIGM